MFYSGVNYFIKSLIMDLLRALCSILQSVDFFTYGSNKIIRKLKFHSDANYHKDVIKNHYHYSICHFCVLSVHLTPLCLCCWESANECRMNRENICVIWTLYISFTPSLTALSQPQESLVQHTASVPSWEWNASPFSLGILPVHFLASAGCNCPSSCLCFVPFRLA